MQRIAFIDEFTPYCTRWKGCRARRHVHQRTWATCSQKRCRGQRFSPPPSRMQYHPLCRVHQENGLQQTHWSVQLSDSLLHHSPFLLRSKIFVIVQRIRVPQKTLRFWEKAREEKRGLKILTNISVGSLNSLWSWQNLSILHKKEWRSAVGILMIYQQGS